MAIITCNENNIADGLHQAYEEGYRQGRIDEAKKWKNKMDNFDKIFEEWDKFNERPNLRGMEPY